RVRSSNDHIACPALLPETDVFWILQVGLLIHPVLPSVGSLLTESPLFTGLGIQAFRGWLGPSPLHQLHAEPQRCPRPILGNTLGPLVRCYPVARRGFRRPHQVVCRSWRPA